MASNSKNIVAIFFLVASTAATSNALFPQTNAIFNVTDPKFQYLGRFAVEQYDKKGESHLYFKEVIFVIEYYKPGEFPLPQVRDNHYAVQLTAINCSQSGAMGNYTACVIKLANTTDPTTGLSYVFMNLYSSPGIYPGRCDFFPSF